MGAKWPMVAVFAVVAGLAGPRLVAPSSRPAGGAFEYVPPDGFHDIPASSAKIDAPGARAWEHAVDDAPGGAVVVVHHSAMKMQVDEPSLAQMAADMPRAFEDCAWVHRRHETRVRPDGARVGLIEGDCDRDIDLDALGLSKKTAKLRKLQLVFPDDDGTSIATVSYPTSHAERFEPMFEASVDRAKNVALRVPPPPAWTHVAWGLGALVLGGLAAALIGKKERDGA